MKKLRSRETKKIGEKRMRNFKIFQFSKFSHGFTLLEMLISTGIFSVVITTAVGAMLSLGQAQVKATNIQNIQDNIRFTLEFMTKEFRTGSAFTTASCNSSGCTEIRFVRQDGTNAGYCLLSGAIRRFVPPGDCNVGSNMTSSAVSVNKFYFNVIGHTAGPSDGQPRITITIESRSVNPTLKLETDFNLQTTVTSRLRDI